MSLQDRYPQPEDDYTPGPDDTIEIPVVRRMPVDPERAEASPSLGVESNFFARTRQTIKLLGSSAMGNSDGYRSNVAAQSLAFDNPPKTPYHPLTGWEKTHRKVKLERGLLPEKQPVLHKPGDSPTNTISKSRGLSQALKRDRIDEHRMEAERYRRLYGQSIDSKDAAKEAIEKGSYTWFEKYRLKSAARRVAKLQKRDDKLRSKLKKVADGKD